jgi:hypothetical protein
MSSVTLGGDRLGAGKKQKVELHNYSRSTHDLSYLWRSTMSSGTLVPFMVEVGLPGDNFEIDLEADIKTSPTVGPLFGSFKVQMDVFSCPIRLYNGKLHMNLLNVGLNMSEIKLPQITMEADGTQTGDNDQINPSSLFSYLNIRGLGRGGQVVKREFNAVPYLAFWDIYKNYYANKQEEIGAYIHNDQSANTNSFTNGVIYDSNNNVDTVPTTGNVDPYGSSMELQFANGYKPAINTISFDIVNQFYPNGATVQLTQIYTSIQWNEAQQTLYCALPTQFWQNSGGTSIVTVNYAGATVDYTQVPKVVTFPLSNIDDMRIAILQDTGNTGAFDINSGAAAPYGPPLGQGANGYCKLSSQEGLAIKTYQSDLFNNWISTEWIDGVNGINEITAIDTSSGDFTINTLQLNNKIYEMLNRIAISGGSYDDWLNAVYTHERTRSQENPMYMGGCIKELGFQEVVSNAQAEVQDNAQALGTLAGRGVLTGKKKGGKIHIRVDEPSYIIGIISLTPRIDYSQGNKWDVNLKTLDDLHKPALDEIGFQPLITDQMAWFDSEIGAGNVLTTYSAGKQPAWINYMTNVNVTKGNFAEQGGVNGNAGGQMYMTLNRRYEKDINGKIKDLTTYIDPSKFNNIFADERLDAQNFWAQIAVNMKARRKMSAKVMPNL